MTILPPGLHYGIPASIYHADPAPDPSLSSTIARIVVNDSLAHAHSAHSRLGGIKKASTEAMGLGSIVHSMMDENPEKDYEVGEFDSYKTVAARDWRDLVALRGKNPVLSKDLIDAHPIVTALRTKTVSDWEYDSPFVSDAKCEVTGIWKEEDAYCRARYDRLVICPVDGARVWDWKTCSDVTDRGIIKSIVKYGYHIQVAFYLRGLRKILNIDSAKFTLVFVETVAPYTVRKVQLSDMFLAEGNRQVDIAIEAWKGAMKTGVWDDPRQKETLVAEMPLWMEDQDIEISRS